ncbi:ImpA family type VI secretion system protein [Serratia sp. UGAL515B_01]|uniref:type VI secretion system protein TssA n=1 Tax=Serratia sp. UGAL515B_01 TaxID=2986763 RepID=UPI00295506A4|nr:type VI secretion system ImpA family N-terminal domain-containing protein [Serratia sp. UGAL515B_01]WON77475.1 type VI secretion system ImpA family N-terminal domain-containing protein [Serratia sp. UGAL515B_01]
MSESSSIVCPPWYQAALQPCAEHPPCGVPLEYNSSFILLQGKLQPKLGAEYGNFVEVVESVNWAEIERDAMALLAHGKDIRLIIALMRCRMRRIGVQALSEGLEALLLMLEQWPDDVHPQLLDEGEFEPMMRANAFAELEAPDGFLADFRQQQLPKAAGLQLSIRDVEKVYVIPREESALSELTMAAIQQDWQRQQEGAIASLQLAALRLDQLKTKLQNMLGDYAPDFNILLTLLRRFGPAAVVPLSYDIVEEAPSQAPAAAPTIESIEDAEAEVKVAIETAVEAQPTLATPANVVTVVKPKEISSRTDALKSLQEVRAWFTQMEPSSPVIALLAVTEQTIGKSFIELLHFLPRN